MKVNKMITPYNHATGSVERIKYIVLHYVGASGSAKSNCNYFMTDGRNASAHYFINHDGEIWQSVEDKDIAWHCTNRNQHCKNSNSIGIEMCCAKDSSGKWFISDATTASAIELTKELMQKYDVPINNVWRHYDCTGKQCPEPWVRDATKWTSFLNALTSSNTVRNGWIQKNNSWYYYVNGSMLKNEWLQYDKHWYRLGAEGAMLTDWYQVADKDGTSRWYYSDSTGALWHETSKKDGSLEKWTI